MIEVRVSDLKDLKHVFHELEFNIEIIPCKVVEMTALQDFRDEVVFYRQPEKAFTWDDFV